MLPVSNRVLTIAEVQQVTSLSRASINRKRAINDFPTAINLGGNRIGFMQSEIEEWLGSRPRVENLEANENKIVVRCPETVEELESDITNARVAKIKSIANEKI